MIEKEPTLPEDNYSEKEEVVSLKSIIKYEENDGYTKSLVVASFYDGDDPVGEVRRIEDLVLDSNFLSKKEKQEVEFCTFRPSHHIASSLIGHKIGDKIDFTISGGISFSCRILDFFIPEIERRED